MKKLLQYLLMLPLLPVAIGVVLFKLVKGDSLNNLFSKLKARDNVAITIKDANGTRQRLFKKFPTYDLFHVKIPFITGVWTNELKFSNLITNAGLAYCASTSTALNELKYIAVGSGTTAAAATDTALETEISASGMARALGTQSNITTTVTNDTYQVTYEFTNSSGGDVTVTEYGLLSAASGGTLGARVVQSAQTITAGSTLGVTWKIALS